MKVTFLGTGTSQGIPVIGCDCKVCTSPNPKDKRLRVSALLELSDKNILIDVGPDFRQQMLTAKVKKVDAILVTHEHRDHVAGLDDVRAFNFKYNMDMPLYTYPRVQEALREAYGYIFNSNYPGVPMIKFETIEKNVPFQIGETSILPIEYYHGRLPIMGFRVNKFAYLTDFQTIKDDQLALLGDLDVLVISALHHQKHYSHITLYDALQMIEQIAPNKAYLIHMSHYMGLHDEIERKLPENVFLAYDGLQIEVN
ncbi:MAG: MBL fold metallo-hydrolase [Saprospiraceae bacterium]|nr:MBL fold metallo-hydrolase [Saprospiraceae bacterium]